MASDGFPSCVLNFLGIFSESHLSAVHSFSESLIGTSILDQSCCCHVIGPHFREISDVFPAAAAEEERIHAGFCDETEWEEKKMKTAERNTLAISPNHKWREQARSLKFSSPFARPPGWLVRSDSRKQFTAAKHCPTTRTAHTAAYPRQESNPWRLRRLAVERRGRSSIAADAS